MHWTLAALAATAAFQLPKAQLTPRRPRATSGADEDGWRFEGRFVFAPQLVRVPDDPPDAYIVNVFGWTLGGVVALEYDSSLVGPYLEFVEMGALVVRNGAIGQWGARLLVSNEEAKEASILEGGLSTRLLDSRISSMVEKLKAEIADTEGSIGQAFKTLDLDDDGVVSREELMSAMLKPDMRQRIMYSGGQPADDSDGGGSGAPPRSFE